MVKKRTPVVLLFGVATLSVLLVARSQDRGDLVSLAEYDVPPIPEDMAELVGVSDVIVLAKVTGYSFEGHTRIGYSGPTTYPQRILTPGTANISTPLPIPFEFSEQTLLIEHVYKDTMDSITVTDQITLIVPGNATSVLSAPQTPTPRNMDSYDDLESIYFHSRPTAVGAQRLFFLVEDPAPTGKYYLCPYIANCTLDISGAAVTVATDTPVTVQFTDNITPAAFLNELIALIE